MPLLELSQIALVGLRGAGKTTVGRLLASRLSRRFVDLDEETVRVACGQGLARKGNTAGELLSRQGVEVFRTAERQALWECLHLPEAIVLATGGGVVEVEDNIEMLRDMAFTVWLQAPPEVLAARVEADPTPRPALLPGDALAEARALAIRRGGWYRRVSKFDLDCSELTPEEAAGRIAELIRRDQAGR